MKSTLAGILTAIVALGIVVWLWRTLPALKRVRFGVAVAHVIAFVTVTTSYNLHALIRLISAGCSTDTTAVENLHMALGGSWIGVTIVMSGLWGIGRTLPGGAGVARSSRRLVGRDL